MPNDDYKRWYNKGWRYSASPTATLGHGDNMNAPKAWYDGYLDYAAGREKWHLATCHGCADHEPKPLCPTCGYPPPNRYCPTCKEKA